MQAVFSLMRLGLLCACLISPWAQAEPRGAQARVASAELVEGALAVNTRFTVHLNPTLLDALEQGVPLTFRLDFELTRPRSYALSRRVADWFEPTAQIYYKLSYLSLTQQYRISSGGLYQNHLTLNDALASIGGIRGWRVLPHEAVGKAKIQDFSGRVRLVLDRSQLPRPFELNIMNSQEWVLDSEWVNLALLDNAERRSEK